MVKGYIKYNDESIAFVLNEYFLDLFSENDDLIRKFCKEYNFKVNYFLEGIECGMMKRKIQIYVDHSIGTKLYVKCYLVAIGKDITFNKICLESRTIDSIFRYRYNLIEKVREDNCNFYSKQYSIYKIPFILNDNQYTLDYKIGYNANMGFLDDMNRCGEISIDLKNKNLEECFNIIVLIERFMKFVSRYSNINYKSILLKNEFDFKEAFIYYPLISKTGSLDIDYNFCEFDVNKYVPKILSNIALDIGVKIENSIPVFHIKDFDNTYSTNRFLNQINSFEYLYFKINPVKAKSKKFSLKEEIEEMLNEFQFIYSSNDNISVIAGELKELRRNLVHGYKYYYDFNNDVNICRNINLLDDLIVCMSMKVIGFNNKETEEYMKRY